MPADLVAMSDVGKVGASGEGLHGCFSPRARASSAPVLQIMPGLLELCSGVLTPPSVEEVRLGSHGFSDVA
jgi:hypothetical protein